MSRHVSGVHSFVQSGIALDGEAQFTYSPVTRYFCLQFWLLKIKLLFILVERLCLGTCFHFYLLNAQEWNDWVVL